MRTDRSADCASDERLAVIIAAANRLQQSRAERSPYLLHP
jgi:hypothetical protein